MTLIMRGPESLDLPADRDGARHVWNVAATVTKAWSPGDYSYSLRATDGTEVLELESGRVQIKPDLAAVEAGYDGRSDNRKALEAIEAVLAKRATLDQERYRINNRELYRTGITELIRLRNYYKRLVVREEGIGRGRDRFMKQVKVVMRGGSMWGKP